MVPPFFSAADYKRIEAMLSRFHSEYAMNLEELDGFFAALICALELVMPSGYLPEICGGEPEGPIWKNEEELKDFFDLLMRYWNGMVGAFESGETFNPQLLKQADGLVRGNDWARGFMRGIALGEEDWRELFRDEGNFGMRSPSSLCSKSATRTLECAHIRSQSVRNSVRS